MLGFLINDKEIKEMEYLLKREMDEILCDLEDDRIDYIVKGAMDERYSILFGLFKRVASSKDCIQYTRVKKKSKIRKW